MCADQSARGKGERKKYIFLGENLLVCLVLFFLTGFLYRGIMAMNVLQGLIFSWVVNTRRERQFMFHGNNTNIICLKLRAGGT